MALVHSCLYVYVCAALYRTNIRSRVCVRSYMWWRHKHESSAQHIANARALQHTKHTPPINTHRTKVNDLSPTTTTLQRPYKHSISTYTHKHTHDPNVKHIGLACAASLALAKFCRVMERVRARTYIRYSGKSYAYHIYAWYTHTHTL